MTKKQAPWSVRGVSQEARAKAAKAADRRRMTIGEWVANALIMVANDELGNGSSGAAVSGAAETPSAGALQVSPQQAAAQMPAELTGHVAEAGRRDHDLSAMAERFAANQGAQEQRLTVLTSAVTALANRLDSSKTPKVQEVSGNDLANAIAPLRMAIECLIMRDGATPLSPLHAAFEAQSAPKSGQPATGQPATGQPATVSEREHAALPPIPPLDYDRLHEKAIDNTRRLFGDNSEPAPKTGLVARLFGA